MTHGHDGWTLVEYEWDPSTELGTFTYEKRDRKAGETLTTTLCRHQPVVPASAFRARG